MPRRAAKDMKAADLPLVKRAFTRWDNRYADLHDDIPRPSLAEMHRATGINESVLGQYKRGQRKPIIEHCLALARWYDLHVDEVLGEFGYPALSKLLTITRTSKWEDRETILALLHMAQTHREWKQADWRQVMWKEQADRALSRNDDDHLKAQNYAIAVYGWALDYEWDIPFARKSTDKLEPVKKETETVS